MKTENFLIISVTALFTAVCCSCSGDPIEFPPVVEPPVVIPPIKIEKTFKYQVKYDLIIFQSDTLWSGDIVSLAYTDAVIEVKEIPDSTVIEDFTEILLFLKDSINTAEDKFNSVVIQGNGYHRRSIDRIKVLLNGKPIVPLPTNLPSMNPKDNNDKPNKFEQDWLDLGELAYVKKLLIKPGPGSDVCISDDNYYTYKTQEVGLKNNFECYEK